MFDSIDGGRCGRFEILWYRCSISLSPAPVYHDFPQPVRNNASSPSDLILRYPIDRACILTLLPPLPVYLFHVVYPSPQLPSTTLLAHASVLHRPLNSTAPPSPTIHTRLTTCQKYTCSLSETIIFQPPCNVGSKHPLTIHHHQYHTYHTRIRFRTKALLQISGGLSCCSSSSL